jgi:hypothetical protein
MNFRRLMGLPACPDCGWPSGYHVAPLVRHSKSDSRCLLWVIRDRIELATSWAMSALL